MEFTQENVVFDFDFRCRVCFGRLEVFTYQQASPDQFLVYFSTHQCHGNALDKRLQNQDVEILRLQEMIRLAQEALQMPQEDDDYRFSFTKCP